MPKSLKTLDRCTPGRLYSACIRCLVDPHAFGGYHQPFIVTEERLAQPVTQTTGPAMTPQPVSPGMGLGSIVPLRLPAAISECFRPCGARARRYGRSVSLPSHGKKGKSRMVSSSPVPWYNCPAREYPIKRWLRARYPFIVAPSALARPALPALTASGRRRFPAQVWQEQQARGSASFARSFGCY